MTGEEAKRGEGERSGYRAQSGGDAIKRVGQV